MVYKFRNIISKNDSPYHFKKIIVSIKRLVITMFCDRLHAWLLIQSRLTTLFTSLHDGRSGFRLNDGTVLNLNLE